MAEQEEDEGWADWIAGSATDAAGYITATASGAFDAVVDTAAAPFVFVAENAAETRDEILETAQETRDALLEALKEISDEAGDDAAEGIRNAALFGPIGLAAGGLLVAVALNPTLLAAPAKSLKKLF